SISSIIPLQYGEIFKYNSIIVMDENAKEASKAAAINEIKNDSNVSDTINVRLKNIEAGSGDEWQKINLVVPEDPARLDKFISIHKMGSKEKIRLTDEGVVIGEKLAKILGLRVGSEITLKDGEVNTHRVKVTGINENYTLHYVYMTPALYKKTYGQKPVLNCVLVTQNVVSQAADDAISSRLLNNKAVLQITSTRTAQNSFTDMVHNLNSIVLVMIVSAGALAFVVLYNLTNINITERIREIASIKVLGFYDIEVSQYVFRENIILTLLDAGIGLLAGIVLDRFVLLTSETDVVMFGRQIYWYSFVFAAALTVLFSVLVNLVMHFRLKKVNMIESLKSVE
ncbi:MAG TPA: ABC transporter permease, partial [Ruminiclostridium sp.]|nr:ABC transporter permease [Ruminiclostridium sp.]